MVVSDAKPIIASTYQKMTTNMAVAIRLMTQLSVVQIC
jgi:hypothetical protein